MSIFWFQSQNTAFGLQVEQQQGPATRVRKVGNGGSETIKQLLVSVISLSLRLRLITLTSTLIIPDITKTESNNCFVIHCFEENNDKRIIAAITVYFQTLKDVQLSDKQIFTV